MMTPLIAALMAAASPSWAAPAQTGADAAFSAALLDVRGAVLAAASSGSQEDILLDRTKDRDPAVRREAVRGLKAYSPLDSRVRERLRDIVKDGGEAFAVRYEAVKSLSPAATDSSVREFLLEIAKGRRHDELQAIACKALYWEASYDSDVRDALTDQAKKGRKAALWSLFLAAFTYSDVQDALLTVAEGSSDTATRVEAAKSLFSSMVQPKVRDFARDKARGGSTPAGLRLTAILMLGQSQEGSDRDLLETIARGDSDANARAVAVVALSDPWGETVFRHFHLVRRSRAYPYPVVHDPLDDE